MKKALLALAFCLSIPLLASGQGPKKPIDINTATVTELTQLPKVGVKTAERIVLFRKQHGGFRRLEEIMEVKGIGEKTFAKFKPFLMLGGGSVPAHP